MAKTLLLIPLILFYCFNLVANAQERKPIHVSVQSDNELINSVQIINITSREEATKNNLEFSTIAVKLKDTLYISAPKFIAQRIIINKEQLDSESLQITLNPSFIQLDEVNINKNTQINAVNLGIIKSNRKTPTPAERALQTAGEFKPIHLLGLIGGSVKIDPIINAISGRTDKLRKLVLLEKKELNLIFLEDYLENYITNTIKYPKENIKQLFYLAVEDPALQKLIDTNNIEEIKFLLCDLIVKQQKENKKSNE